MFELGRSENVFEDRHLAKGIPHLHRCIAQTAARRHKFHRPDRLLHAVALQCAVQRHRMMDLAICGSVSSDRRKSAHAGMWCRDQTGRSKPPGCVDWKAACLCTARYASASRMRCAFR